MAVDFPAQGPPVITILVTAGSGFGSRSSFSGETSSRAASFRSVSVVGFARPFSHLETALSVTFSRCASSFWVMPARRRS